MMSKATLREQLDVLRVTHYANVPRVRYVMQSFLASSIHSVDNRASARQAILGWARRKWPGLIPPKAYEGNAFEHDQAGLRIAATGSEDGTLWAFRSEHLGTESRTWITEALVADLGPCDAFGVRNSCSTITTDPIPVSSPAFLRTFVAEHSLVDAATPVTAKAQYIENEGDLARFLVLLASPDRSLPIVAVSRLINSDGYAIDPQRLARQVQGLAHVYCIEPRMTYGLSDEFGKPLSVYNGAIRTYYPGFSHTSDPWKHDLIFPQRVSDWTDEIGAGSEAFERYLTRHLHLFSIGSPARIEQLPSYFVIRRKYLEKPNKTSEEEIQILNLDLELARGREQDWQTQALESDAEARAYEEDNRQLRAQNLTLAHEVRELRKARGETTIPEPTTYTDIPHWVDAYFADRIVLHSRAIRALKEAVFQNINLVCESIKLLAEAYWAMCSNHDPAQREKLSSAWDSGVKRLGLEYNSHALTSNRLGEFRSDYTINYRIGNSTQQILGPHLKYGSTKDDRYCMRIYFFWDDDRQLVVIGSLPAHLETRIT